MHYIRMLSFVKVKNDYFWVFCEGGEGLFRNKQGASFEAP